MCRMLAVVSRKSVPTEILLAFRGLADTGKTFRDFGCPQPNPKAGHPDGWGLACVGQDGEVYVRSGRKASTDPKYEEAVRRLAHECSPPLVLLAHVRRATKKDTIREEWSHPFRKEIDGRVAFFGLNGEIGGFGLRDRMTDSQYIFERFLEALGTEPGPLGELKQAIATAKAKVDAEFPRKVESYTFLLVDGHRVVAHRDARTCVPYYALHETRTEDLHLVCSEVLPVLPGRWRMLRNGEFLEMGL